MAVEMTRRELVKTAGVVAAGSLLGMIGRTPPSARAAQQPPPSRPRRRALRMAHLTDIHVQPERRADQGMIACLRHVRELDDKPELVVTGGDLIMDSFEAGHARTQLQWELFTRILRDECALPLEHCLGNHDVWGWNKKRSETTGDEPQYGKKWALDVLGLERSYRSFDRRGWHFVILDSVSPLGDGYIGRLDEPQFEWLESDLRAVPRDTPIIVVSHIPILAACVLNDARRQAEKDGAWKVSGSLMMVDSRKIRERFAAHPNVRLCLSGHIHLVDRVDYNGVTYLCNGAVSGNWWKGRHYECTEGYALLNLYDDGSFEHEYVTYGWAAEKA